MLILFNLLKEHWLLLVWRALKLFYYYPYYNSMFCSVAWLSSSLPALALVVDTAVAVALIAPPPLRRALSKWVLTIESANCSHCVGWVRTMPSWRGDGGGMWNVVSILFPSSNVAVELMSSWITSPSKRVSAGVEMPFGRIMLGGTRCWIVSIVIDVVVVGVWLVAILYWYICIQAY